MKRSGTAIWLGSGKEGKGHLSTQSGNLKDAPYGYASRYEDGIGTNPEELVGAAHARCFSMHLSFKLREAGFTSESLETKCEVTFENNEVVQSNLILKAKVPTVPPEKFMELAEFSRANCPISKLLKTKITLDATLL